MKTLEQIKDEVALKHNFECYDDVHQHGNYDDLKNMVDDIAHAWALENIQELNKFMANVNQKGN